jgi:hypothetical protein
VICEQGFLVFTMCMFHVSSRCVLRLPCSGPHYSVLVTFATLGLLVITVGIPLLFVRILYINLDDLWNPDSHAALQYSFLYLDFKRHRWWYEAVEMFERVVYATVGVFMSNGSVSQISTEILVAMVSLLLLAILRPYESTVFQQFGLVSRCVVVLTLYSAQVGFVQDQEATPSGSQLGVLLILINTLTLLLPLLYVAYTVRYLRQNKNAGLLDVIVGQRTNSLSTMAVPLLERQRASSEVDGES